MLIVSLTNPDDLGYKSVTNLHICQLHRVVLPLCTYVFNFVHVLVRSRPINDVK